MAHTRVTTEDFLATDSPKELVRRVVERAEKEEKAREAAIEDDLMAAAEPVVWAGFHGFWSNGYGAGECDPQKPRRTRYRWNDQTHQLELVEEKSFA